MRRWVAVWIAGGEGSPRSLAMTRFRNWSKPASASSCRCSRICVRTWCSAMTDRTFRGPITNWSAAFVVSRRSIAGSVAARTGTATCCATDAASPTRPGGKRMPTDSTSSNSMPADSITVAGASCDGSPKPLRASNSSAFVSATSGRSTSTHLKLAGLPLLRRHFCPDGTNTDTNSQTTVVSTPTNKSDGSFSVSVPITGGTTVLNTVAVSPSGATAHDQRTIVFDFTPGKVVFDVTDPSNDDNGPGNYAYPTAGDFHAGAFDIQAFRVIISPDGSTVTFKLQTRDLSPTFGSPLGAQLVDVYVHNPSAASSNTSMAASFPQRNYAIDSSAAWSRLIEVQGFGQRYIDAHNSTMGTVAISANAISRFITFSVPTSTLVSTAGEVPGSGWGFTVTLTGQDGFSPDQARGFTATPQPFAFGVCATTSSDTHCTVDPNTVPKVMDTITLAGVTQSDELDYTLHNPVTLRDIVIP